MKLKEKHSNHGNSTRLIPPLLKSFFCILLIFFCNLSAWSQTSKTTGQMTPGVCDRTFYKFNGPTIAYGYNFDAKVGYELPGSSSYHWEKGLEWDISSIPATATINSCEIYFTATGILANAVGKGSIVFTSIGSPIGDLYEQIFNLIKSGDALALVNLNSQTTYSSQLPGLVARVQSVIASSHRISVGAWNGDVPSNYGTSFSSPKLKIDYTVPTPPQPTNLRASSLYSTSFVLEWTASTGNVTEYRVMKDGVQYGAATSSTSMLISGLNPGTTYQMKVVPWNSYGPGDESAILPVPTLIYSITGNTLVCSSPNTTFTFHGRPTGTTIAWTNTSNVQAVSGATTDNYTAKAIGNGNGWVKATLSTGEYINFPIYAGTPIITVTGPSEGYPNVQYTFQAHTVNPTYTYPFSYTWDMYPYNGYISTSQGGNYAAYGYVTFYAPYSVAGYRVMARAQNGCGTGAYGETRIWIHDPWLLSPNPASEFVTLTKKETDNFNSNSTESLDEAITIYDIKIIDFYGSIHYTTKKSGNNFSIPVHSLKDGNYIIQITSGDITSSVQLIVKH